MAPLHTNNTFGINKGKLNISIYEYNKNLPNANTRIKEFKSKKWNNNKILLYDEREILKMIPIDKIRKCDKLPGKSDHEMFEIKEQRFNYKVNKKFKLPAKRLGRRGDIHLPEEMTTEAFKYIEKINELNKISGFEKFPAINEGSLKIVKMKMNGEKIIQFLKDTKNKHPTARVLKTDEWFHNYVKHVIPNDILFEDIVAKFQNKELEPGEWVYFPNILGQPHLSCSLRKRLPLRCGGQIANFYEPFLLREKRKDGKKMTIEEKRERQHLRMNGLHDKSSKLHYIIEAMCPYCSLYGNNFDHIFFGRFNSEYLHHVTKHHAVGSAGVEMPLPSLVALGIEQKNFFALCSYCDDVITIKDPLDLNSKNPFLNYLRHVKHIHHNILKNKNAGDESRFIKNMKVIIAERTYGMHYY